MIPNPCSFTSATLKRVLVVDDEPAALGLASECLRPGGYEIITTPEAREALELVGRKEFAVIVSDQRMPGLSGLEFFKQVKLQQPHTARILLTGVADLDVMIEAINEGEIFRFMVKPWLPKELVTAVEQASAHYLVSSKDAALRAQAEQMNEEMARANRTLAGQVALSEQQNRALAALNKALHQNLQHSIEMCVKTMQTFYPSLGKQARRVAALCKAIAEELRLSPEQRQTLEISGWLHDVGLVGVPRELIGRWHDAPGKLTEAETALIQRHPLIGQELSVFVAHLSDVGTIIRAHHERLDGTGYPDGLAGDSIPWLARLLAVAVSYAHSQHEGRDAVAEIAANRGTAYDPEAVRVVLDCLPQAVLPKQERGVRLGELIPGMVLATGIYNAQGLLILPEGHMLSEAWIDRLKAHDRVSPLNGSFQVY